MVQKTMRALLHDARTRLDQEMNPWPDANRTPYRNHNSYWRLETRRRLNQNFKICHIHSAILSFGGINTLLLQDYYIRPQIDPMFTDSRTRFDR